MTKPKTVRYTARFTPQAWVNDYAIEVDAEGPQEWDCTEAVLADWAYFEKLQFAESRSFAEDLDDGGFGLLDNDDMLKGDPQAPEWVRDWRGPFDIRVRQETSS